MFLAIVVGQWQVVHSQQRWALHVRVHTVKIMRQAAGETNDRKPAANKQTIKQQWPKQATSPRCLRKLLHFYTDDYPQVPGCGVYNEYQRRHC